MSNDLTVSRGHALATPLTYRHHHLIRDADPCWGIGLGPDAMPTADVSLPPAADLVAIKAELEQALLPCSMKDAAEAAQYLMAAFPQQDRTSAAYAEQVTARLMKCPRDMLKRVLDRLIDGALQFRPTAGAVNQAVEHEVAKRRLLLMRADACLRVVQRREAEDLRRAEVARDRKAMGRATMDALAAAVGMTRVTDEPKAQTNGHRLLPPIKERPKAKVNALLAAEIAAKRQKLMTK